MFQTTNQHGFRLPKTWGNQLRGRVIINGYNMMEHDTNESEQGP